MPYRFVGSYEYQKALAAFEKLVSVSTVEELAAYDKVLNNRPEFTYFNGANALLAVPPNLRTANFSQRDNYYNTFRKRGLAWMMALAKVELSATASMYGDAKKPFQTIRTSQFDLAPYLQVLADDVVAHMRSLEQEPGFRSATRSGKKIDTWTLAYLRRLKLVRDMLSTLSEVGSAEIKVRLKPYDIRLASYEKKLMHALESQTGSITSNTASQSKRITGEHLGRFSGDHIKNCVDLVNRVNSGSKGSESRGKLTASQ